MRLSDIFKRKSPGAVLSAVDNPNFPPPKFVGGKRELTRGMWVRWHDQTGIITQIRVKEFAIGENVVKIPDVVDVTLTDDDGFNRLAVQVPFGDIRQARLEEIPKPRRPAAAIGQRLGY